MPRQSLTASFPTAAMASLHTQIIYIGIQTGSPIRRQSTELSAKCFRLINCQHSSYCSWNGWHASPWNNERKTRRVCCTAAYSLRPSIRGGEGNTTESALTSSAQRGCQAVPYRSDRRHRLNPCFRASYLDGRTNLNECHRRI
eukprot:scaffold344326_cov28-Prasinocladus_malaysianus.AAC.1